MFPNFPCTLLSQFLYQINHNLPLKLGTLILWVTLHIIFIDYQFFLKILLTSELSGQLWNTCAWDPTPGTALMTYKGSSASPQTLCLLGNEYLINAANNKPLIHIWALQRKVSCVKSSPDKTHR